MPFVRYVGLILNRNTSDQRNNMKTCSKCKIERPKSGFYKRKDAKDGLKSSCKVCYNKWRKKYIATPVGRKAIRNSVRKYSNTPKGREANNKYRATPGAKKVKRNSHLKRNYGITLEQYNDILKDQDYVCAICGTNKPGDWGVFHVDHCHKTDKVRGLLCGVCNRRLGWYEKNKLNIFQYLNRPDFRNDIEDVA